MEKSWNCVFEFLCEPCNKTSVPRRKVLSSRLLNKFNLLIIEMTGCQELLRMHAILIVPNVRKAQF